MAKAPSLALCALALASCAIDEDGLQLGRHDLLACPNFACAQNGPELNSRPFHELSEAGEPNAEGYILGPLVGRHRGYALRVVGWELVAVAKGRALRGDELVGAAFDIDHRQSGRSFRVRIRDRSLGQLYAGALAGTPVPLYSLEWTELASGKPGAYSELCRDPEASSPAAGGEPTVFFEGTRYDRARKLVLPGDNTWFNLACKSDVMAKLLLTGQTSLSGGRQAPTLPQQQAVLKALVADYCGDGRSFTVAGEPLLWKTANGAMRFARAPGELEARWGANGPLCLAAPRLVESESLEAAELFPPAPDGTAGIWAAIRAHCPARLPPPCDSSSFSFEGAYVVTANP